jgi:hypothetical protein
MLKLSGFGHIWVHFRQPLSLSVVCGVDIAIVDAQRNRTQSSNLLQLRPARWGIAASSKLQRLQSCKTGIAAQKEPAEDNTGSARGTFFSKYTAPDRSLATALRNSDWQQQSTKTVTVFKEKHAS